MSRETESFSRAMVALSHLSNFFRRRRREGHLTRFEASCAQKWWNIHAQAIIVILRSRPASPAEKKYSTNIGIEN